MANPAIAALGNTVLPAAIALFAALTVRIIVTVVMRRMGYGRAATNLAALAAFAGTLALSSPFWFAPLLHR